MLNVIPDGRRPIRDRCQTESDPGSPLRSGRDDEAG